MDLLDVRRYANADDGLSGGASTDLGVEAEIGVVSFEAPGLGDRSYLVHDGNVAVVVDPQREQERYIAMADALGVSITHVFETHVHNDYVSGGLGLARELGVRYVLPEGEDLAFAKECLTLGDGAELATGSLTVSALATPGHTPNHLSYLLKSRTGAKTFVCTGGSVLPGGVGRTDLVADERADELARAQWHSVRRLLAQLDASTEVLPTHGFGSFCSATPSAGAEAGTLTIGLERQRNPAAGAALEDFVTALGQDRPPVPSYYRYMAPLNRGGPRTPRYAPTPRFGVADLDRWLAAGSYVVDVRPRRAFAAGHRHGALNIELGDNLTTYFGWVVPFEAPYTLVTCSYEDVERNASPSGPYRARARLGFHSGQRPAPRAWAPVPGGKLGDLWATVRCGDEPFVLDVRHLSKWRAGHLALAHHVPLPELGAQRFSLPPDRPIWVHCAAGFRAAIAASQLSAWGLVAVLIDDLFERAGRHNLDIRGGDGRS